MTIQIALLVGLVVNAMLILASLWSDRATRKKLERLRAMTEANSLCLGGLSHRLELLRNGAPSEKGLLNPDIIASKPVVMVPHAEVLRSAGGPTDKPFNMQPEGDKEIFAKGPNASRPMILETDTDTDTDTAHPPRTRKIVRGLGGISHEHRPGHP